MCGPDSISLLPFVQSAVVSAPHGRWVEELSRETTKRTEEERQVGRDGGERIGCYCWGKGKCSGTSEVRVAPLSSGGEREDEMGSGCLRWMETTGMSAKRWSWCVYVAHLRPVWSEETEVCVVVLFLHGSSSGLRAVRLRSGPVCWMWGKFLPFFGAITLFLGMTVKKDCICSGIKVFQAALYLRSGQMSSFDCGRCFSFETTLQFKNNQKKQFCFQGCRWKFDPYVAHRNLVLRLLYSPLECEFESKTELKVNPHCSTWCPVSNSRRFCRTALSLTPYEVGQGSPTPHVQ